MSAPSRNDAWADAEAGHRDVVVPFPVLGTLTPVVKPSGPECVEWRLAAFYGVVRDHLGREDYPHPCGVWLNPRDGRRLRRWAEEPLAAASGVSRRTRWTRFWIDKGPAVSEIVAQGQIVITGRAYPERAK